MIFKNCKITSIEYLYLTNIKHDMYTVISLISILDVGLNIILVLTRRTMKSKFRQEHLFESQLTIQLHLIIFKRPSTITFTKGA